MSPNNSPLLPLHSFLPILPLSGPLPPLPISLLALPHFPPSQSLVMYPSHAHLHLTFISPNHNLCLMMVYRDTFLSPPIALLSPNHLPLSQTHPFPLTCLSPPTTSILPTSLFQSANIFPFMFLSNSHAQLTPSHTSLSQSILPGGVVGNMLASHTVNPGSIPGRGDT